MWPQQWPLSTWRGRARPGTQCCCPLPRLRPWGPCGSRPTRPRPRQLSSVAAAPSAGPPAWVPPATLLATGQAPRPQRVGSWCPTTAGTLAGLSASPGFPLPAGLGGFLQRPVPPRRPPPCVHLQLEDLPAHPALGAVQGLQSSDFSDCPGSVGTLGRRRSWTGWGPEKGPGTASPSAPGRALRDDLVPDSGLGVAWRGGALAHLEHRTLSPQLTARPDLTSLRKQAEGSAWSAPPRDCRGPPVQRSGLALGLPGEDSDPRWGGACTAGAWAGQAGRRRWKEGARGGEGREQQAY